MFQNCNALIIKQTKNVDDIFTFFFISFAHSMPKWDKVNKTFFWLWTTLLAICYQRCQMYNHIFYHQQLTCYLQPLDAGIIQNLSNYRKFQMKQLVDRLDAKKNNKASYQVKQFVLLSMLGTKLPHRQIVIVGVTLTYSWTDWSTIRQFWWNSNRKKKCLTCWLGCITMLNMGYQSRKQKYIV